MGFIDVIKERAKAANKTIVLPETEDSSTDPERGNRKDHSGRKRRSSEKRK